MNENYFHVYRFFNIDMNKSDSEYILCIIFKNVSLQFFESIHFPKISNINRTKYLIILFKSKKKNWLEKNLFFRFKNIQICFESLKPIKSSSTLSSLGETLLQWDRKRHFFSLIFSILSQLFGLHNDFFRFTLSKCLIRIK